MKKINILLFVAFSFLLFSCNDKPNPVEGVTSYTLVSKINFAALGYGIDVTIYEYDAADNKLDSNLISQPKYKEPYTFYPSNEVDHLKMKLTSTEQTVRWANKIFFLTRGQNTELVAGLSLITDANAYCFNEPTL